jgi:hypothetical protein
MQLNINWHIFCWQSKCRVAFILCISSMLESGDWTRLPGMFSLSSSFPLSLSLSHSRLYRRPGNYLPASHSGQLCLNKQICGRQNGNGTNFYSSTLTSPIRITPPSLRCRSTNSVIILAVDNVVKITHVRSFPLSWKDCNDILQFIYGLTSCWNSKRLFHIKNVGLWARLRHILGPGVVCLCTVCIVQFVRKYSALVSQNLLCSLFITVYEVYKSDYFSFSALGLTQLWQR